MDIGLGDIQRELKQLYTWSLLCKRCRRKEQNHGSYNASHTLAAASSIKQFTYDIQLKVQQEDRRVGRIDRRPHQG